MSKEGRRVVIGHRGAPGYEEEHTFKSYDKAIEMGADYIEIDLQLTQDGNLVISHDGTVDRMTDGTGKIKDMSLAEIKRLRTAEGQQILTLDELIQEYGNDIKYYIETKRPHNPDMDKELVRILKKHNLIGIEKKKEQVIIQSFSEESLQNLQQQYSDIFYVQLMSEPKNADLDKITEYASGVGPKYANTTKDFIDAAHDRGLLVHPYTINNKSDMEKFVDWGVDGFFTNYTDRGVEVMKG